MSDREVFIRVNADTSEGRAVLKFLEQFERFQKRIQRSSKHLNKSFEAQDRHLKNIQKGWNELGSTIDRTIPPLRKALHYYDQIARRINVIKAGIVGLVGAGGVAYASHIARAGMGFQASLDQSVARLSAEIRKDKEDWRKATKRAQDLIKWGVQYKIRTPYGLDEVMEALSSFAILYRGDVEKAKRATRVAALLASKNPRQGLTGAMIALQEAETGYMLSPVRRFNLPKGVLMKHYRKTGSGLEAIERTLKELRVTEDLMFKVNETLPGLERQINNLYKLVYGEIMEGIYKARREHLKFVRDRLRNALMEHSTLKEMIQMTSNFMGSIARAFYAIQEWPVRMAERWLPVLRDFAKVFDPIIANLKQFAKGVYEGIVVPFKAVATSFKAIGAVLNPIMRVVALFTGNFGKALGLPGYAGMPFARAGGQLFGFYLLGKGIGTLLRRRRRRSGRRRGRRHGLIGMDNDELVEMLMELESADEATFDELLVDLQSQILSATQNPDAAYKVARRLQEMKMSGRFNPRDAYAVIDEVVRGHVEVMRTPMGGLGGRGLEALGGYGTGGSEVFLGRSRSHVVTDNMVYSALLRLGVNPDDFLPLNPIDARRLKKAVYEAGRRARKRLEQAKAYGAEIKPEYEEQFIRQAQEEALERWLRKRVVFGPKMGGVYVWELNKLQEENLNKLAKAIREFSISIKIFSDAIKTLHAGDTKAVEDFLKPFATGKAPKGMFGGLRWAYARALLAAAKAQDIRVWFERSPIFSLLEAIAPEGPAKGVLEFYEKNIKDKSILQNIALALGVAGKMTGVDKRFKFLGGPIEQLIEFGTKKHKVVTSRFRLAAIESEAQENLVNAISRVLGVEPGEVKAGTNQINKVVENAKQVADALTETGLSDHLQRFGESLKKAAKNIATPSVQRGMERLGDFFSWIGRGATDIKDTLSNLTQAGSLGLLAFLSQRKEDVAKLAKVLSTGGSTLISGMRSGAGAAGGWITGSLWPALLGAGAAVGRGIMSVNPFVLGTVLASGITGVAVTRSLLSLRRARRHGFTGEEREASSAGPILRAVALAALTALGIRETKRRFPNLLGGIGGFVGGLGTRAAGLMGGVAGKAPLAPWALAGIGGGLLWQLMVTRKLLGGAVKNLEEGDYFGAAKSGALGMGAAAIGTAIMGHSLLLGVADKVLQRMFHTSLIPLLAANAPMIMPLLLGSAAVSVITSLTRTVMSRLGITSYRDLPSVIFSAPKALGERAGSFLGRIGGFIGGAGVGGGIGGGLGYLIGRLIFRDPRLQILTALLGGGYGAYRGGVAGAGIGERVGGSFGGFLGGFTTSALVAGGAGLALKKLISAGAVRGPGGLLLKLLLGGFILPKVGNALDSDSLLSNPVFSLLAVMFPEFFFRAAAGPFKWLGKVGGGLLGRAASIGPIKGLLGRLQGTRVWKWTATGTKMWQEKVFNARTMQKVLTEVEAGAKVASEAAKGTKAFAIGARLLGFLGRIGRISKIAAIGTLLAGGGYALWRWLSSRGGRGEEDRNTEPLAQAIHGGPRGGNGIPAKSWMMAALATFAPGLAMLTPLSFPLKMGLALASGTALTAVTAKEQGGLDALAAMGILGMIPQFIRGGIWKEILSPRALIKGHGLKGGLARWGMAWAKGLVGYDLWEWGTKKAIPTVTKSLPRMIPGMARALPRMLPMIGRGLMGLARFIPGLVARVGGFALGGPVGWVLGVGSAVAAGYALINRITGGKLGQWIGGFLNSIFEGLLRIPIIGDLAKIIHDFFASLFEKAKQAWNWGKEKLGNAWDWTKEKTSQAWNWTKNSLGNLWNRITGRKDGADSQVANQQGQRLTERAQEEKTKITGEKPRFQSMFDRFLEALAIQESGGRNIVGKATDSRGDRAYGIWQVMGRNIRPWLKQYVGIDPGSNEKAIKLWMSNPELQRLVVSRVMSERANKLLQSGRVESYEELWQRLAASWYGGPRYLSAPLSDQPVTAYINGQPVQHPAVSQYAKSVIEKMDLNLTINISKEDVEDAKTLADRIRHEVQVAVRDALESAAGGF